MAAVTFDDIAPPIPEVHPEHAAAATRNPALLIAIQGNPSAHGAAA
jgi:hypothetical protein